MANRQTPVISVVANFRGFVFFIEMEFNYILDKSSRKFVCPNCLKKTFVRFIDNENNYADDNFGRCDREQKCGYFQNPIDKTITANKKSVPIIKTDYLPLTIVDKYFSVNKDNNNFLQFLKTKFNIKQVEDAEINYLLSTINNSVIFWQIDQLERVRSGKIMSYNKITGKRLKDNEGKSLISWMHKQPFNLRQCLFGLHNILEDCNKNKNIAIVESEKTAVIMSIVFPNFLWMACGSNNGFKIEYLEPIKNKKIIALPDKGCFEQWNKTANFLNDLGFKIEVSNIIENNESLTDGDDIADEYFNKL